VKVPMELFVYEADHAFCNDKRPEVYNADACKLAWDRTLAFVQKHTGSA
jgi:carboxymethylenebutenolidase